MTDSFKSVAADALALLDKTRESLEEADRLLGAEYGGTEKWCAEVAEWRLRKNALIDCGR